jgi:hypothetical protein
MLTEKYRYLETLNINHEKMKNQPTVGHYAPGPLTISVADIFKLQLRLAVA